jgi:DNA repair photolyase
MIVTEISVKSALSRSRVYDYVVNPYRGCQHGCTYCYARFMKKYSGHREPWGKFVDVKVNAADLLRREVARKKKGCVWVSGVCDPYQPLEKRYKLTRACLDILIKAGWPVRIQTRSPLVVRDIDLFQAAPDIEVGLTITTGDDKIRRIFEPGAPSVTARINALATLHNAGIRTFVMVAPLLPGARQLAGMLRGKTDRVLIDRMNYHYADWVYRKYHLENAMSTGFFQHAAAEMGAALEAAGISCEIIC